MFFLGHCCVVPWSKNGLGSGLFLLFVLALIETETLSPEQVERRLEKVRKDAKGKKEGAAEEFAALEKLVPVPAAEERGRDSTASHFVGREEATHKLDTI